MYFLFLQVQLQKQKQQQQQQKKQMSNLEFSSSVFIANFEVSKLTAVQASQS